MSQGSGRPKGSRSNKRTPGANSRSAIYLRPELDSAFSTQVEAEQVSKSGFIADLLQLLLLTPSGKRLTENAAAHQQALVQELERSLILFVDQFPVLGQKLQENADGDRQSLAQELIRNLRALEVQVPIEEIDQLARNSRRPLVQMMIHLLLIGLQTYQSAKSGSEDD